ncbi:MAG: HD domain-containing protein [Planctomycetes bacterium]|nr:HD domain-containing protein [Planctomycetota bacterium]
MSAPDARRALAFLREYNSLEGVLREGWVMSGVPDPEDVAAHSAGVGVAALLIADRLDVPVDRGRLLAMALLHDLGEARTGDVPLIRKTPDDEAREHAAADDLVSGLPSFYREVLDEVRAQESLEARIVKAADKLQMMAKVLAYEAEGRGDLSRFWENPRNFHDAGLPAARALFEAVRAAQGG